MAAVRANPVYETSKDKIDTKRTTPLNHCDLTESFNWYARGMISHLQNSYSPLHSDGFQAERFFLRHGISYVLGEFVLQPNLLAFLQSAGFNRIVVSSLFFSAVAL